MKFRINKLFIAIVLLLAVTFTFCSAIPKYLLPKEDDTPKQLIEKARNLYELGHTRKSLEVYTIIIEEHKGSAERSLMAWAYYEKGFLLYMKRKWKESLKCFEEVVRSYGADNQGAYILAYKFCKRINYAMDTGNKEILIHRSSYAVPDNYEPIISPAEDEETENSNSNDANNSNDSNDSNNNTDTDENDTNGNEKESEENKENNVNTNETNNNNTKENQ